MTLCIVSCGEKTPFEALSIEKQQEIFIEIGNIMSQQSETSKPTEKTWQQIEKKYSDVDFTKQKSASLSNPKK